MVPLPYRALKLGEEAPGVNIVTHENQRCRKKIGGGRKMTSWWTANFAGLIAPLPLPARSLVPDSSLAVFTYAIVNRELLALRG